MKRIVAVVAVVLMLTLATFAKDRKDYQVGVLQHHVQNTARIGTDYNGINCDGGRCVGSASGIYQTSNWWSIRVDGGYWELQPNFQDNSKHNPLNTASEGDKIVFRMDKRHYLNGTADVAYLPRTDDPDKEVMLIAKWHPDHPPVVAPQPKPKSQLEVACESGKVAASLCSPPSPAASAPVVPPPPATALAPEPAGTTTTIPKTQVDLSDPRMAEFKRMCDSGLFKQGVYANLPTAQKQCDLMFPPAAPQASANSK